jgi:glucose 1-dehydrogenase
VAVNEIEAAGGSAVAMEADVSKEDQVEAVITETVRRFGTFHIMVVNAGIERPAPIAGLAGSA